MELNLSSYTVEELLAEIGNRAVRSGIVESRGNLCLMAITPMSDHEKDEIERSGWGLASDEVLVDMDEYSGNNARISHAASFGISFIKGM